MDWIEEEQARQNVELRFSINLMVRRHAQDTKQEVRAVWRQLYDQLEQIENIKVYAKPTKLDYVSRKGLLPSLYRLASNLA